MLLSDLVRFGRYLDPWSEFEKMNRALSGLSSSPEREFPAVNIWKGEDHAMVTAELPGINPQGLDISVAGKSLTLRGVRSPEEAAGGDTFHRRERWYGKFTRTLDIPFDVDADKIEARFIKGVLYIALPRAEADKPRKISIKPE